jgi:hypothetical protein
MAADAGKYRFQVKIAVKGQAIAVRSGPASFPAEWLAGLLSAPVRLAMLNATHL